MKQVLQGTHGASHPPTLSEPSLADDLTESEPGPDQIYQLVLSIIEEDLLYLLAVYLHKLPFEARKDTQVILSYVFRFRPPTAPPKNEPPALAYVLDKRPQVLVELCRGYDHKESSTPAGTVLREVLKNEAAAAIILYDDGDVPGSSARGEAGIVRDRPQSGNGVFWAFFDWIDKSSFEVAADAFTTFRVSPPCPPTTKSLALSLQPPRNSSPSTRTSSRATSRSTLTSSSRATTRSSCSPTAM